MKTKNQLKKIFNDFANSHYQINTFGYGQEFEQQAMESVRYPLLWVVPMPYQINGVDCNYTYRVIVVDRVFKDEENETEVESDTDLILKDFCSYVKEYGQNNDLTVQTNITFTPTFEKWADEVSGVFTDITLTDTFDWSSCALPLLDAIPDDEFNNNYVYTSPTIKDKSITIPNPLITDDFPLFYTHKEVSVRQINDVVDGDELDYNIYYAPTKNSVSPTKLWTVDRTATNEAGSETETFNNAIIPAGSWVWVKPSSVTNVDIFSFTIFYKITVT